MVEQTSSSIREAIKEFNQLRAGRFIARFPERMQRIFLRTPRIELYETWLQTPEGARLLSPDITVQVDVEGTVDREQGWIFKEQRDMRFAYLTVKGGGWTSVIELRMDKANTSTRGLTDTAGWGSDFFQRTTREMREFAARLEGAAHDAPSAYAGHRAAIQRGQATLDLVVQEAEDAEAPVRARVGRAHKTAAHVAQAHLDLLHRCDAASQGRTLRWAVDRTCKRLERAARDHTAKAESPPEPKRKANPPLLSIPPKLESPADVVNEVPDPPERVANEQPLGELERLAALHSKGVLTDEEFSNAKARLLERL